jgi:hypothetical protein
MSFRRANQPYRQGSWREINKKFESRCKIHSSTIFFHLRALRLLHYQYFISAQKSHQLLLGKLIAKIPPRGGIFGKWQLPKSASWPALEFLKEHVRKLFWAR